MTWWAIAGLVGFVIGGIAGFFVGVDAGLSVMAEKWLKRHPDEGDLRIGDD